MNRSVGLQLRERLIHGLHKGVAALFEREGIRLLGDRLVEDDQPLLLGERRGDFVTVLAGLEGGEVVVDSPRATLNEGSPVRIADRQN